MATTRVTPALASGEALGNGSGQANTENTRRSLPVTVITASGSVMGGILLGEAVLGPAGAVVGGLIGAGAAFAMFKRDEN